MRRTIFFSMVALFVCLPAVAMAFSLVSMQPNYGRFEVFTDEPLVIVFDQSLDATTVQTTAVAVADLETGAPLVGATALGTTTIENDTLVFTPTGGRFPFARRLLVELDDDLRDLTGGEFTGELPHKAVFVANIPNDLERPDPGTGGFSTDLFVNSNVLLGFNPLDPESTDPAQTNYIPGLSATEAWKMTTGDPEIVIAIVDVGTDSLAHDDLADNLYLNKGELPQPRIDTDPCADWDCNGDGRFNARDYENDPDVSDFNGNGRFDPEDIVELLADGVDNDGNGLVDDISGWDFFRNVNTPLGVDQFPEGCHGKGRACDAACRADNGRGNKPGVCPNCSILLVRVGEAIMTEFNIMTAGVEYAKAMGADVIEVAMGVSNYSSESEQVFIDAYEEGVFTVAASGDELGFHHIWPAAGEDVYNLTAIMPLPPVELFGPIDLSILAFVQSYCTNFGAHIETTGVTGACTSEATANMAGIAGLLQSWAKKQGLTLTPGEIRQLLNMTADDIKANCFAFNMQGCKAGWEQNFGYGRVNADKALKAIGDPYFGLPERIPPEVRITAPRWWTTINPSATSSFDVEGYIYARGRPYEYEVQIGFGVEPRDRDFIVVDEGSGAAPTEGVLATVNAYDYIDDEWLRRRPADSNDFTVTIRVQAWWSPDKDEEVLGEYRKAIAWHIDDHPDTGLTASFPQEIGASGESSVALYDMDGDVDGALEIIFATAHPTIEMYKRNAETGAYEPAPGFPVDLPQNRDYRDAVIGSVAVGPLFGDGVPYIVTATNYGLVYAVHPDGNNHAGGPFVAGFPVSADEPDNTTALSFAHGNAFLSSPVLADLDLDGMLEIIAASYDQQGYAWKVTDEDGDGAADCLPGWPVPLNSKPEFGLVGPEKICDTDMPAQVLGTPVVAILDPDHPDVDISAHPAVIIPTTETCNESMIPTGRVYAIYWNGLNNEDGPFLPDWPAKTLAPAGDSLPIPPLTIGTTSSPAAAYYQGELLVGIGTFFWFPQMNPWANNKVEMETLGSGVNLGVSANGSFGKFEDNDDLWYFFPTAGFLNATEGNFYLESFNVVGWRLGDAAFDFRKHFEDINFFVNPVLADLHSDGKQEMIAGSGGYIIHASDIDLAQPDGWPKFTQNWSISSPAVGDLDGDRKVEVVQMTHEGNLFAWQTIGQACNDDKLSGEWPRFHHDNYNSGMYGNDSLPPRLVRDLQVYFTDNPDVFEVRFTAPGDDLDCGAASLYEIRYTTKANDDLRDADAWYAATTVAAPEPLMGGEEVVATIEAPGAVSFAMRAYDDQGLISPISNAAAPTEAPPADDDAADDDTPDDDTSGDDDDASSADDDDDDDDGCGC